MAPKRIYVEVEEGDTDVVLLQKLKQSNTVKEEEEDCKKFQGYLYKLQDDIQERKRFYLDNVVFHIKEHILEEANTLYEAGKAFRREILQELNKYHNKSQTYIREDTEIFDGLHQLKTPASTLQFLLEVAMEEVVHSMTSDTS